MGSPNIPLPTVKTRSLSCPNCGGTIQIRGFAHSLTAVCQNCLSVLDTSTPEVSIIQQIEAKLRRTPKVPLGSRGKLEGTTYEVIGFQTRGISVEGVLYEWDEYVIFNPYKGFLYITEYQGHWNIVRPVRALPQYQEGSKPKVIHDGRTYKHFQNATARTEFVLGEFPWRLKVGEEIKSDDYTSPPYVLSAETTADEVTWSLGEYVGGDLIWRTFQLKDKPPSPVGTYVNQPNPNAGKPSGAFRLLMLFLAGLLVLTAFFLVTARRENVFNERHHFAPADLGEKSFVTPIFELKGRTSNVVVETKTDAMNNWISLGYALINADTGTALNFAREISFYSDGSDTEGNRNDSTTIPSVPPGRYYLLVDPEGDAKLGSIEYDIIVRRDVPNVAFFLLAAFALLIPPLVIVWRTYHFEQVRWRESDYSSGSSSSGDDD